MPGGMASPGRPRSSLLFDGTESITGRAFLTVSSLYWALDWLECVSAHFIGVTDPNVAIALEAFTRDTGVEVTWDVDGEERFQDAAVYAGIAFRSGEHMRLAAAREHGVPVVCAIQYPIEQWVTASTLIHQSLSHNPRRFAAHLGSVVRSLIR